MPINISLSQQNKKKLEAYCKVIKQQVSII